MRRPGTKEKACTAESSRSRSTKDKGGRSRRHYSSDSDSSSWDSDSDSCTSSSEERRRSRSPVRHNKRKKSLKDKYVSKKQSKVSVWCHFVSRQCFTDLDHSLLRVATNDLDSLRCLLQLLKHMDGMSWDITRMPKGRRNHLILRKLAAPSNYHRLGYPHTHFLSHAHPNNIYDNVQYMKVRGKDTERSAVTGKLMKKKVKKSSKDKEVNIITHNVMVVYDADVICSEKRTESSYWNFLTPRYLSVHMIM